MPINMNCPSCGKLLAAPDSAAGKRAKCPECGQIMIVPAQVLEAELIGDSAPLTDASGAAPPSDFLDGLGATGPQAAPAGGAGESRRPCPECGEMIMAAAAKCRFCGTIFDPRMRGAAYRALGVGQGSPAERIRQIRAPFTAWWACLAAAAAILVVGVAISAGAQSPEFAIGGVVLALIVALIGAISYLVLLYRLWAIVQDGRAQTTPGCAVGFMFIPCFNIYWQFVAIWGLSKELNRVCREYGFAAPEANEGLSLTACILHCCACVPYIGVIPLLAWFIVIIVALKGMCDTAIAMVGAPAMPGENEERNLQYSA